MNYRLYQIAYDERSREAVQASGFLMLDNMAGERRDWYEYWPIRRFLATESLDDDTWYALRNTPGVTGFVNINNVPIPLPDAEVQGILKGMTAEAPKVKVSFAVGDTVRITDGPFADFRGEIDEINQEKGKIRVLVSFFGRETPVELDFLQAERES